MANQNRAKYYYEPMRTQSKNKQTATGAKKLNTSIQVASGLSLSTRLVKELAWGFFISLRGHLEKIYTGGSTQGAEQNSN